MDAIRVQHLTKRYAARAAWGIGDLRMAA
jgi:hypothetical protein